MSTRLKRKYKVSRRDKTDYDVLEATDEAFRIQVDAAIQSFISDPAQLELPFPNLNNLQRKHIHQKAIACNLISKSRGKDPNRILSLYKKSNRSNFESFYIELSSESRTELRNLLARPPEANNNNFHTIKGQCGDKVIGKLSLGPPCEVVEPVISSSIGKFQKQLPIYEMRADIVNRIRRNKVLIVSSETGSGKTTQIPQYIMEDCRSRGETCRILCTQPRRISAVSVAERVAFERGSQVGDRVGYHVRLESKLGFNCNLIYCTNGVLIRSLMSGDQVLTSLSHIIIDEVHERDKLSDFLLICLRQLLDKGAKIKVILMSATIDIDKFRSYFQGADVLSVPGRLFPIKQLYLDEILTMTGYDSVVMEMGKQRDNFVGGVFYEPNPYFDDLIMQCAQGLDSEQAWVHVLQYMLDESMPLDYQHSQTGLTALMAAVVQDNADMVEKLCGLGCDPLVRAKSGASALSVAEDQNLGETLLILNMSSESSIPREDLLTHYYKTCSDEDINHDLVVRLIQVIHRHYQPGAILVFLPGYDDIMMCNDRIVESDLDRGSYRVFFLHGSMNIKEQHDVFKHLPNMRKIILSTNIAETSLTIDDVVYVIDSGKAKVLTYDSLSGLSSLQTQWISKACVKQRSGRAGRTQSGMSFHLFSKSRYNAFMEERVPEILRVPLEELCLNTKTLAGNFTSIYDFLVLAPDPPSPNTVKTAIENLECLGALDKEEHLTPLGEYLGQLTIEPHLGKMLIYSVIFKCLDPILTIVASMAQKDPFLLPPQANLKTYAAEKRRLLMEDTCSDHMVYLRAFIKWQESVKMRKEKIFCREFFISASTMETILKTRCQLLGQLRASKFVPPNGYSMIDLNINSDNWPVVKAVISSGLYPKLAFRKGSNFCTRMEKKVTVHNSSPVSRDVVPVWLVYDDMVKSKMCHQLRGVTAVSPITISLMCGVKSTTPEDNCLEIDDWLEFEFPAGTGAITLRRYLETIVVKKLASPMNALTESEEAAMICLSQILRYEDAHANLTPPVNLRSKPKFFELNRQQMEGNTSDGYLTTPGHAHSTASHDQSAYCGYGNAAGYRKYNNRSNYNNYNSYPVEGAAPPNPLPGFGHLGISNGGRGAYKDGGCYRRQNGCHGQQQQQPMYQGGQVASTSASGGNPGNADRFVIIRVKQENSVRIAQTTNEWVFAPQTEKAVVSMENAGATVYLLFLVNPMNCFFGMARFQGLSFRAQNRPKAAIEWIFTSVVPFKSVSHLRNPLDGNRLVVMGVDGQIVEWDVAKRLWDLFLKNSSHQTNDHNKLGVYYNK